MALLKSFPKGGKKQAPMPGPKSAAYKKLLAKSKGSPAKGGAGKPANKNKKHPRTGAFSSLKARQQLVERVKRAIWASVSEINDAIIQLAKAGNFTAAKALFDFAGVYSLPDPEEEEAKAATTPAAAVPTGDTEEPDPVEGLFRSIGMPLVKQPEPEMAAAAG
jgi:hypothetical protein